VLRSPPSVAKPLKTLSNEQSLTIEKPAQKMGAAMADGPPDAPSLPADDCPKAAVVHTLPPGSGDRRIIDAHRLRYSPITSRRIGLQLGLDALYFIEVLRGGIGYGIRNRCHLAGRSYRLMIDANLFPDFTVCRYSA
jgi:hypothetical protein